MSFMPLGSNTYGMRAPITGPTNPMIPGMNPMGGMQGLLENPLFGAGLGLLSANQRSPVPPNYAQGIMGGLQMSQSAQQQRTNNQRQQAEYDMQMKKLAQEQQEWTAKQDEARRVAEAQAELENILKRGGKPEEIAAQLAKMGDYSMLESINKPQEEWGEPYIDSSAGKPMLVQKSLTTGQLRSVGAGGVEVNVGGTAEPVGDKASKYIMPDGGAADPRLTVDQIMKSGGRLLTADEITAKNRAATIGADDAKLQEQVSMAQQAYDDAARAYEQNKNPETFREMNNAASRLKTAIAGRENWRGEPSDGVANRFTVPGPIQKTVEDLITPFFESSQPKVRKYNPQTGRVE